MRHSTHRHILPPSSPCYPEKRIIIEVHLIDVQCNKFPPNYNCTTTQPFTTSPAAWPSSSSVTFSTRLLVHCQIRYELHRSPSLSIWLHPSSQHPIGPSTPRLNSRGFTRPFVSLLDRGDVGVVVLEVVVDLTHFLFLSMH